MVSKIPESIAIFLNLQAGDTLEWKMTTLQKDALPPSEKSKIRPKKFHLARNAILGSELGLSWWALAKIFPEKF